MRARIRGCDLIVQRGNETFFVEVKGRTREWEWVSCSEAEVRMLEGKPEHAFLLEVIIDPGSKQLVKIKKWSAKNIVRKRPHTISLYFSEQSLQNACTGG